MSYMPKEERRRAILEATIKLAGENGFAGLTARAIAKELGAATGLLHHHFSSLTELKCAAFQYSNEKGFNKLVAEAEELTPKAAIRKLLASYPEHGEELEIRIWMSAADEAQRSPEMAEVFAQVNNDTQKAVASVIRRGIETGEFERRMEPDKAAWKLISACFTIMDVSSMPQTNLTRETALEIVEDEITTTLGAKLA
ncbi:TetR family transcriptional regulator [Pseudovibrio exalbescens]|uniref:TetR family transcriptional regulator n=1 Tax=Pseudovibrio exalbescens TaxID=197461 RepID=UPI00236507ED|nr:TetR family transcriptional regulator [Pseudovibrio exalbescens]MDD7908728.1 TetR family transcriptional regulator [Pseudovibrio exalbescens]